VHSNSGKKFRFDSRYLIDFFDSIRQSDKFAASTLIFIIVMMVSLVKGLAASHYAVVHSVPYQYQLDNNFQQVKNV